MEKSFFLSAREFELEAHAWIAKIRAFCGRVGVSAGMLVLALEGAQGGSESSAFRPSTRSGSPTVREQAALHDQRQRFTPLPPAAEGRAPGISANAEARFLESQRRYRLAELESLRSRAGSPNSVGSRAGSPNTVGSRAALPKK